MQLKISKPFWQVIGVGILAGMRTASAPYIAAQIINSSKANKLSNSANKIIHSGTVVNALKAMAIGEFIVDKLPFTPNRTRPDGLIFRGISGAIAGAAIFKATGINIIAGALLGGVAAVASTYGSFHLRRSTVTNSGILDPVIGAIEDAMVIGAGIGLTKLSL